MLIINKINTLLLAILIAITPGLSQESSTASDSKTEEGKPAEVIENDETSYFNKNEMEFLTGEEEYPWDYGRVTLGTDYLFALSGLTNDLSYQGGIMIAFDHGLHHLFNPYYKRKSALIPGLRLEFNYNFYGPVPVTSFSPRGGLIWLIPLDKRTVHNIVFSGTAGMAFMSSDDPNFSTSFKNNALSVGVELGYQIFLSDVFLSLTGRFHYISDATYPWIGVGGQLAMGYRFTNTTKPAVPKH